MGLFMRARIRLRAEIACRCFNLLRFVAVSCSLASLLFLIPAVAQTWKPLGNAATGSSGTWKPLPTTGTGLKTWKPIGASCPMTDIAMAGLISVNGSDAIDSLSWHVYGSSGSVTLECVTDGAGSGGDVSAFGVSAWGNYDVHHIQWGANETCWLRAYSQDSHWTLVQVLNINPSFASYDASPSVAGQCAYIP